MVGGNAEATGKVVTLLASDALVTVISPSLTPELNRLYKAKEILWKNRKYMKGDLDGSFLAIVADTSDVLVNLQVSWDATALRIPVNVMDVTHMCSFIAPAISSRGDVKLAISTGGSSPALARKFRELLDQSSILNWADISNLLSKTRRELKGLGVKVNPDAWQTSLTEELLSRYQQGYHEEVHKELIKRLTKDRHSD